MKQFTLLFCCLLAWTQLQAQCSLNPTTSDPSCGTVCDGSINPNPTGGTTPYTYSWNDGSTQPQRSGLCGGSFSVTVTDALGCTVTSSFTLTQPSNITANVGQTPESCAGNDGTASVNPTGGVPGYTYLWTTGATTNIITGLNSGTYTVTITDSNGCGRISNITVFNTCPPCNLSTSASASPASCAGICTGTATTFPSNGAAPFTYLWNEGSTTQSATGLCPGVYTVTVTDNNNCSATATANVGTSSNVSVSINASDETCAGNDGTAIATGSGGVAPYSYMWSTGSMTDTLTNLVQGNYAVTVTDVNGCTASNTASIGFNNTLVIGTPVIVQQVACFGDATGQAYVPNGGTGYSYLWSTGEVQDTAFALVGGINRVTVTSPNGCSRTRTVVIQQPSSAISSTAFSTVVSSCDSFGVRATAQATGGTPGYSYLWSTGATTNSIDSVQASSYDVTVTDANGCTDVSSVTVPTIAVPPSISIAVADTPNCSYSNDGALDLTVDAGTPASFLWSNNATTEDITGLTVGNYTVIVVDTNGCSLTESFTLTGPAPLNVTINRTPPSNPTANDGLLTATANGGTAPYQYEWDDMLSTSGPILAGVNNGTYSVTVTDGNGCVDSISFDVTPVLTSISTTSEATWRLFPNPNRGTFQVQWSADLEVESLSIFDALGREIRQVQLPAAIEQYDLRLQGLAPGQYILQLRTAEGYKAARFTLLP